MRVTHIVSGDLSAGAAKGALWLHNALNELGVDSTILTDAADWRDKKHTVSITRSQFDLHWRDLRCIRDRLPCRLYRNRRRETFSTGYVGARLLSHPAIQNADIVNLHWINKGFFKIKDIGKLSQPIVWTLRDVWAMTGGCHVPLSCQRYNSGCGRCPILASTKEEDLSSNVFRLKQQHYPDQMTIVGISRWLTGIAANSPLLGRYKTTTIPNCIDVDFFRPGDQKEARMRLNLHASQKYVLFGAMQPERPHKGYQQFLDAINSTDLDITVLVFGQISQTALDQLSKPYLSFGRVSDQKKLRDLYISADLFVAPSLMESFGKTLAESQSCGTPVVAFDTGGPADIVEHQVDGFLAEPFLPDSLRKGIEFVLKAENKDRMSEHGRTKSVQRYSFASVANEYRTLYQNILSENN